MISRRAEAAAALQGLRGVLGSLSPAERGPLSFLSAYLVLHESLESFQRAALLDDIEQVCPKTYEILTLHHLQEGCQYTRCR